MSTISTPEVNRKRVVVTGMGAISPLGFDLEETWQGVLAGKSTADFMERFDASSFPVTYACQVPENYQVEFSSVLDRFPKSSRREVHFGLIAADEAVRSAGISSGLSDEKNKFFDALILGSGMGTDDFAWLLKAAGCTEDYVPKPYRSHPSELARLLNPYLKLEAKTSRTMHAACASSAEAIGEAYDLIASGEAEIVLTGGADSMVEPLQFAGVSLIGALATTPDPKSACRPFDRDRGGFVFGEGAAMLVLESYEHAKARHAPILAEILGYGMTQSAFRLTDLKMNGDGPKQAMELACHDAKVHPSEVDYINAHGTGTVQNDAVEALIIHELFPQALVSSTKPMTGHMIAAAGAIEAVITILSIQNQILPPSISIDQLDPDFKIQLTASQAESHTFQLAMSNSLGFGGTNVSLVIKGGL